MRSPRSRSVSAAISSGRNCPAGGSHRPASPAIAAWGSRRDWRRNPSPAPRTPTMTGAGHAELALDPLERVGIFPEQALALLHPVVGDHAAGELDEALREDALPAVGVDDLLVVGDAVERGERAWRMPGCRGLLLERLEPGGEAGGAVAALRGGRARGLQRKCPPLPAAATGVQRAFPIAIALPHQDSRANVPIKVAGSRRGPPSRSHGRGAWRDGRALRLGAVVAACRPRQEGREPVFGSRPE